MRRDPSTSQSARDYFTRRNQGCSFLPRVSSRIFNVESGGSWCASAAFLVLMAITSAVPLVRFCVPVSAGDEWLKLTNEGALEGKLTVTFTGLEASWRRVEERNEDDAHHKKFLEDYVKEAVPVGIDVELTNKPDWTSSSPNLTAEYTLRVPGWVSGAGKRALLPVGLFSGPEKHMYEHATRVHPFYFHFMNREVDDVEIALPLGWQVSSLPQPVIQDAKAIVYNLKMENKNGTLHLERQLKVELAYLEPKYYPTLRNFYQLVKNADEQQIVLQPMGVPSGN